MTRTCKISSVWYNKHELDFKPLIGQAKNMLQINGFYEVAKIMRLFLSQEYVFTVSWENQELRVAHHKGSWELVKMTEDVVVDKLIVFDNSAFESKNSLLKGLAQVKLEKIDTIDRNVYACAIVEIIEIWFGNFKEIKSIDVVQPGRNAMIDDGGDFCLGPRQNEWSI